ncbi:MAG: lysyl endopeptidase [Solirubrobacteraceae bacterium]|nr:lysyl endopeptidase [Solirubrobacteraceae bacterium]
MVDDPSDAMAGVLDELESIASKISDVLGSKFPDPLGSLERDAVPTVQGLSMATTTTIAQQLAAGIRCLDLRVSYAPDSGDFFTYHGLTGTNLTAVLADITTFLQSATAEVLYITMGHYTDATAYGPEYAADFSAAVKQALEPWAYRRSTFQFGWYRPGNQQFYIADSSTPSAFVSFQYGNDGDLPLSGDWTGQGLATVGLFRPGNKTFYLASSNAPPVVPSAFFTCDFAQPGDVPVAGRWNASAQFDTIGLFREAADGAGPTFYLWNANGTDGSDIGPPDVTVTLDIAAATYLPLVGDWEGQGFETVGLYRAGFATFYLWYANGGGPPTSTVQYGTYGDAPVVGDWTSSGVDTLGVLRVPSTPGSSAFYLNYENLPTGGNLVLAVPEAQSGDVPLAFSSAPANPFRQTLAALTNDLRTSRVILVNDASPDPVFWPGLYSPPSGGPGNPVLAGYYTDTNDADAMIAAQTSQLASAIDQDLPFALYLTLTPSTSDAVDRVLTGIADPLSVIALAALAVPVVGPILASILEVLIHEHKTQSYPWMTLQELTTTVAGAGSLTELVTTRIMPSTATGNPISMIYADFFESTTLVDLAIQLSSMGPATASAVAGPAGGGG